jgi:hypothetical protein
MRTRSRRHELRFPWRGLGEALDRLQHPATHHEAHRVEQIGTESEPGQDPLANCVTSALDQAGSTPSGLMQIEAPSDLRAVVVWSSTQNESPFNAARV